MGGGFYNCRSVTKHAKNNGTGKKTPKKGALVVFRNGAHIGSIINYNGSYIYTNEGNTSSSVGVESPVIKKWPLLREGNLVDICDTIKASDGSEWHYIRIAGKYYGFVATKYIKRQRDRDTGKGY